MAEWWTTISCHVLEWLSSIVIFFVFFQNLLTQLYRNYVTETGKKLD